MVAGLAIVLTRRVGLWLFLLAFFWIWVGTSSLFWVVGDVGARAFDMPLTEGTTRSRLEVDAGVLNARVTGATTPQGAERLLGGQLKNVGGHPSVRGDKNSDLSKVNVQGDLIVDSKMELSPLLSWGLRFRAGTANLDLNLRAIEVERLEVQIGAGRVEAEFGQLKDGSVIGIEAGAGSIQLRFPDEVGIELTTDTGFAIKNYQGFDTIEMNRYRSRNWDSADKRIRVSIKGGFHQLNIDRSTVIRSMPNEIPAVEL